MCSLFLEKCSGISLLPIQDKKISGSILYTICNRKCLCYEPGSATALYSGSKNLRFHSIHKYSRRVPFINFSPLQTSKGSLNDESRILTLSRWAAKDWVVCLFHLAAASHTFWGAIWFHLLLFTWHWLTVISLVIWGGRLIDRRREDPWSLLNFHFAN